MGAAPSEKKLVSMAQVKASITKVRNTKGLVRERAELVGGSANGLKRDSEAPSGQHAHAHGNCPQASQSFCELPVGGEKRNPRLGASKLGW